MIFRISSYVRAAASGIAPTGSLPAGSYQTQGMPAPFAPAMSEVSESPMTRHSPAVSPAAASTCAKKRGSGLANPISSEIKTPSNSPRIPSESSLPYCAAGVPFVMRNTLPRARSSRKKASAPGRRKPVRQSFSK